MSRAARLANGSSSGLKSSAAQVRSITPIISPAPSVTGVAAHAIEVRASAKCSVPVTTDGARCAIAVPIALVPIRPSPYRKPGASSM